MIKLLAAVIFMTAGILFGGIAHAQTFDVTCPGGKVYATPTAEGVTLVCVAFTPTPTATDTPIPTPPPTDSPTSLPTPTNTPLPPTATRTPTNTTVPPTATSTPVPPTVTSTPVAPTATPTSGAAPVFIGAGDIANCNQPFDTQTAALLGTYPNATIFTLGDNVYPDGTAAQFTNCFQPTWGQYKSRIKPSPGNHDYHTAGASGYFGYFGAVASGPHGYYSYNLGEWHIIVLNSEIDSTATSPQVNWLKQDLANNPKFCTLAYWHAPLFSSGEVHGNDTLVKPFWDALYAAGADVVLNGHDHTYERFAPQNPQGVAEPTRGIREFVVGTGGVPLYAFASPVEPNSEARNNTDHGVLKLTLHPTSYDWDFVSVAGKTFDDSGSGNCVNATGSPPTPTPVVPVPTATATATTTGIAPTPTRTPTSPPPTATATPGGPVVAFPGAEGFGAQAVGGRGGAVIEVTNLSDTGTGSLRACIQATGPRTCVFRTGGTITLNSPLIVTNPFLTIAGQTAPGDGITLRSPSGTQESGLQIKTKEVIVRYLRFRPGTVLQDLHILAVNAGAAATGTAAAHNIVLDHLSISWGGDEMLILYGNSHHITVQWSSISESLPAPSSGSVAIKGIILGADNAVGQYTLHHNLLAHNNQRNPNVDVAGTVDLVNNVVYNWSFSGTNLKNGPETNLVGNYVKPGPNTSSNGAFVKLTNFTGSYYLNGNVVDGQVKSVPFAPGAGVATRFAAPAVTTQSAAFAKDMVLSLAGNSQGLACDGSWFMRRDSVDERIAQSVIDGTRGHNIPVANTYNQLGYISTPNDVGGWPVLAAGTSCPDTDKDGMPSAWELAYGLNPNVNDSAGDKDGDGYTNLESYLNGME